MKEFDLIARHFAPLSKKEPGALGLKDDAALIRTPPNHEFVITKDLISQGIHFIGDENPGDIARKLLRTNLSDLASMGASPYAYLLGLALPANVTEDWIATFASALAEDQEQFGISLIGGDTIATKGPLSLSLTALGHVPDDKAMLRRGAQAGDLIYVSGTIGDAALGLDLLIRKPQWNLTDAQKQFLINRYRRPEPRIKLGIALREIAHACLDISDGLMQDLGHLCDCSSVGASIDMQKTPLSDAAQEIISTHPEQWQRILSGGDDYELLFAAPIGTAKQLEELAKTFGHPITPIGAVTATKEITVKRPDGSIFPLQKTGYEHFT